jgi:hypothetical protein
MTVSSRKILTSSMPGMVFTPSLFNVLCNLLSSVVVVLCTAFFFLKKAKTHSFFQKHIQFLALTITTPGELSA